MYSLHFPHIYESDVSFGEAVYDGNKRRIRSLQIKNKFGLDADDGKLHILMVAGDKQACGHVRIELPSKYINRNCEDIKVFPVSNLDPALLEWLDMVVWQRQSRDDLVMIRKACKAMGKPMIYETDDNFHAILENSPAYLFYQKDSKSVVGIKKWIEECDYLTTSTDTLGKFYSKFNKNNAYTVLPNSLDFEDWPQPGIHSNKKIRIGWAGSMTHYNDLIKVAPAIHQLQKEFDIEFVMLGWDGYLKKWVKSEDQLKTVNLTNDGSGDALSGIKREHHNWTSVLTYPYALQDLKLDIALAPLEENEFNASKSNIKVLEYWASKIPVIATKYGPYNCIRSGVDGLLVKREHQWYNKIRLLIENKPLRLQLAENGYKRVKAEFDMAKNYKLWADFYRSIKIKTNERQQAETNI